MRTLLRHVSSGQYFAALNKWTPDRDEAHDFGPVARAAKFAHKARFADMELVVSFEESEPRMALSFGQFRFRN